MKINDIILEAGVGQELWRRATMRPEQKQELEQMESMLVKLTTLPLAQVQKNSKDILKKYKELLNQNNKIDFDPIDKANVLAVAIKPFYPEVSKKIMNAYNTEKYQSMKPEPDPTPKPDPTTQQISIGGQTLDPGDPLYKQLLAKMQPKSTP